MSKRQIYLKFLTVFLLDFDISAKKHRKSTVNFYVYYRRKSSFNSLENAFNSKCYYFYWRLKAKGKWSKKTFQMIFKLQVSSDCKIQSSVTK